MTKSNFCPFCNIKMYEVVNEDYPKLETYLCYECGFHADTILMEQKSLYEAYQRLYFRFNDILKPKYLPPRNQHPFKTPDDSTEPKFFKYNKKNISCLRKE
ncbi:MAG TPA: hypothetical protein VF242_06030 [Nitrososphaeraceae archaeon]